MNTVEVHRVIEPPKVSMAVAGLVRTLDDRCSLTAVCGHLGHEGHAVETALVIECRDNLRERFYLDGLTDAEWMTAIDFVLERSTEHCSELPISNWLRFVVEQN